MIKKFNSVFLWWAALPVVLGAVWPGYEVQAQTQFQDTVAAKAFIAEDYALALDEFNALRKNNPNNSR